MFGHSAGAQFVHRYLALAGPDVDIAIAANCGWYMLPSVDIAYPDGMGGLGLDQSQVRAFFSKRLILLTGSADTDETAADLPRSEAAVAQGPHRFARGEWYFNHCNLMAERLAVTLTVTGDARLPWVSVTPTKTSRDRQPL
jgi:hypothetical protein